MKKLLIILTGIFISDYIKTLYNNVESTVLNKDNSCKGFKIQRGVRQGCPLSEYLFIRALETLANKIRNDKNLKGIKIDKKELKIRLLADITLLIADLIFVKHSMEILKCYAQCAGRIINVKKIQAKYIGSLTISDYFPPWFILDKKRLL